MTEDAKEDSLRWLDQTATVLSGEIEDVTPRALAALEGAIAEGGLAVPTLLVWFAQFARYGVELAVASGEIPEATSTGVVEAMRQVLATLPD
jgi:hypothetical protein